jgi:hypothetical protein
VKEKYMWPLRRSMAVPWRCPDRQAPPSTEAGSEGDRGTALLCSTEVAEAEEEEEGEEGDGAGVRAWAAPPPAARRAEATVVDRNRAAV